jgi:hypothetical protein
MCPFGLMRPEGFEPRPIDPESIALHPDERTHEKQDWPRVERLATNW